MCGCSRTYTLTSGTSPVGPVRASGSLLDALDLDPSCPGCLGRAERAGVNLRAPQPAGQAIVRTYGDPLRAWFYRGPERIDLGDYWFRRTGISCDRWEVMTSSEKIAAASTALAREGYGFFEPSRVALLVERIDAACRALAALSVPYVPYVPLRPAVYPIVAPWWGGYRWWPFGYGGWWGGWRPFGSFGSWSGGSRGGHSGRGSGGGSGGSGGSSGGSSSGGSGSGGAPG